MILFINTSTPVCTLFIQHEGQLHEFSWESGRSLAAGLLGFIQKTLAGFNAQWSDICGIVVFRGPGSFTGLRIGISVANATASNQHIPIVGVVGDEWVAQGIERLARQEDDKIVLPEYGAEAHITTPRK